MQRACHDCVWGSSDRNHVDGHIQDDDDDAKTRGNAGAISDCNTSAASVTRGAQDEEVARMLVQASFKPSQAEGHGAAMAPRQGSGCGNVTKIGRVHGDTLASTLAAHVLAGDDTSHDVHVDVIGKRHRDREASCEALVEARAAHDMHAEANGTRKRWRSSPAECTGNSWCDAAENVVAITSSADGMPGAALKASGVPVSTGSTHRGNNIVGTPTEKNTESDCARASRDMAGNVLDAKSTVSTAGPDVPGKYSVLTKFAQTQGDQGAEGSGRWAQAGNATPSVKRKHNEGGDLQRVEEKCGKRDDVASDSTVTTTVSPSHRVDALVRHCMDASALSSGGPALADRSKRPKCAGEACVQASPTIAPAHLMPGHANTAAHAHTKGPVVHVDKVTVLSAAQASAVASMPVATVIGVECSVSSKPLECTASAKPACTSAAEARTHNTVPPLPYSSLPVDTTAAAHATFYPSTGAAPPPRTPAAQKCDGESMSRYNCEDHAMGVPSSTVTNAGGVPSSTVTNAGRVPVSLSAVQCVDESVAHSSVMVHSNAGLEDRRRSVLAKWEQLRQDGIISGMGKIWYTKPLLAQHLMCCYGGLVPHMRPAAIHRCGGIALTRLCTGWDVCRAFLAHQDLLHCPCSGAKFWQSMVHTVKGCVADAQKGSGLNSHSPAACMCAYTQALI